MIHINSVRSAVPDQLRQITVLVDAAVITGKVKCWKEAANKNMLILTISLIATAYDMHKGSRKRESERETEAGEMAIRAG